MAISKVRTRDRSGAPNLVRCLARLLVLAAISAPWPLAAGANEYAGSWNMTTMRLAVTVESWGENCGPEPKSYATNRPRPVEINDLGSHLVFSTGGVRTDRCWSPNPRVTSISELAAPGRWERVCQTQKGDPKFERGEYSLVAKGADLLEYKGVSKFDWTLKESHCVAVLDERRTYVRQGVAPEAKPESDSPAEIKPREESKPGCDSPGPLTHFSLAPRRAVLGPGQRACFRFTATDAKGCRVSGNPAWSASQGGVEVSGLMGANGCFNAGETAADAEGSYAVTAKLEGYADQVEVLVSFPELGELLAARLDPLGDKPPVESGAPAATTAPAAVASAPVQVLEEPSPLGPFLWVALGMAVLVAAGLGVTLVLLLKRRASAALEAEDRQQDAAPWSAPPAKKACPSCGRTYEVEASFCPHDRSKLIELQAYTDTSTVSPSPASGMVCPRCHRGYEVGSRFCPHDAEPLISYDDWKVTRKSQMPRSSSS